MRIFIFSNTLGTFFEKTLANLESFWTILKDMGEGLNMKFVQDCQNCFLPINYPEEDFEENIS